MQRFIALGKRGPSIGTVPGPGVALGDPAPVTPNRSGIVMGIASVVDSKHQISTSYLLIDDLNKFDTNIKLAVNFNIFKQRFWKARTDF